MESSYEYIISACLCGEKCRYDGKEFTLEQAKELIDNGKALIICPEVLGGMSVPRPPCEIVGDKVINIDKEDKTDNFKVGAIKVLEIANKYGIKKAILKEKSPSCGSKFIYDGSFNKKLIPGEGITTSLLRKNGIHVISDEDYIK
ncbi:uncharacterized protein YbbK (DUF523 family) [Sedimentibacter acidaminivorans]|uniref:Uncharacterized protein YbbK (DUF523 family) n=1 Tax=Sedimentibacter acidaminivorans TaxID=913099 RepID=A0ABS4GF92_9FIRM|nr:DUF523 domain-containing protein [Sedimentibacter acidaminivorans]MBP1926365.1 uncharacterized protein YbbK (DUF523 family) [Sedimentibacter acidaminivorans]